MSKRWESSCQTLQRTITVAQYSETSDWNHPSLPLELPFKVKKIMKALAEKSSISTCWRNSFVRITVNRKKASQNDDVVIEPCKNYKKDA